CSSNWHLKILRGPPICSGRSLTALTESTGGCRWRYHLCLLTTPPALSPRLRVCMLGRAARMCESRFLALKKAYPQSKSRFSPVCLSTSRYYFHASITLQRLRLFCAGSSGVLMRDFNPTLAP